MQLELLTALPYFSLLVVINTSLSCMIIVVKLSIATDVCQAVSSSCETDNTAAIISGMVVAVLSIVAVTVIVTVMLRSRSGKYSTPTAKTR